MLSTIAEGLSERRSRERRALRARALEQDRRSATGRLRSPRWSRGSRASPRERAYFAAGRFPYYLGRAHLETGAVEKGLGELASVIRDYPLSYYMALAYARLAERDRALAERTLAEAVAREPEGAFTLPRGHLGRRAGLRARGRADPARRWQAGAR
jgi:hypothetical protein